MEQQTMKIQDLTLIALMAALTCILGPMSITLPFTPVPISFTNLVIYFAVMVIGMKRGTISYLVYLLIGAVTYAFGTIWLCAQMHLTFVQGLYAGVIPYLPGDAAKIVIAIIVGSAVKKAVVKARVLPE